jgi:hypothetical protein
MRPRSLVVLLPLALASSLARADEGEPPVLAVEARIGGALSATVEAAWRPPPMNVSVGIEGAVLTHPWTSFHAQVTVDALRGTDLALSGGVRVRPGGPLRLGFGATSIVAPTTAAGARATLGACFGRTIAHLCADLEGTAYLLGEALPDDTVVADVRLVIGVAFHLL